MNKRYIIQLIGCFMILGLAGFVTSCDEDDGITPDNSLMIISQTLEGDPFVNGVDGISQQPEIVIIFSHTLNTSQLESALALNGPGGAVGLTIEYSNSNSTVTIRPTAELEYETTYTLSLPEGSYAPDADPMRNALSLSFTTAPFIPANVTMTSDQSSISEDGGKAVITLTLSMVVTEDVMVTLGYEGSASKSADYSGDEMVTIVSGEKTATVEIDATQDGDVEGTEEINITITNVENAVLITPQMLTISIIDDDVDSNGDGFPDKGFIINEVLFDPPSGDAGDANGDGTRSASEDEFIEFVNDSDVDVDLSGYTLYDATNLETGEPRHTFPDGTIIPAGGIYVLFGGGNPTGDFGTAQVAVSTTGNMNFSNADDVITILDTDMNVFLTFDTQVEGAGISFGEDQSVTRNPDINGDFDLHFNANSELAFSPGKKADGSNFEGGGVDPGLGFIVNEVLFDPPSGDPGDANGDGTRSASEDEFIEFVNDSDQPVDLSGYRLFDATNLETGEPRHTFADGTIIPAGGVLVLFGGGTPSGDFGNALVAVSTTGNMNLSNAADVITILDPADNVFLSFDTDTDGAGLDFGADQSITRSPDIDGPYVLHTTANAALNFTPGKKADGSDF